MQFFITGLFVAAAAAGVIVERQASPDCNGVLVDRQGILDGINFLNGFGDQPCDLGRQETCSNGAAIVTTGSGQAPCSQIASAASIVLGQCSVGSQVQGQVASDDGRYVTEVRTC